MGSASSSRSKAASGSGAKGGAEDGSRARPSKGAVAAPAAAGECADCVDCRHCKFMRAGPCSDQYAKAHDCVKEAADPDQVCSHVVQDLGKCISANQAYHHCLRSFSESYVDEDVRSFGSTTDIYQSG